MALGFTSLIGPALSLGSSLIGGNKSNKALRAAAQAMLEAQEPYSTTSPLGEAIFNREDKELDLALSPQLQAALEGLASRRDFFGSRLDTVLGDQNFVQNEVDRLRQLAAPRENALRASLRSSLFNQGRLGLGTFNNALNFGAGGVFSPGAEVAADAKGPVSLSGATLGAQAPPGITPTRGAISAQPELAALEAAFAQADLARIPVARQEQRSEEQRLFGNILSAIEAERILAGAPNPLAQLGIASRPSAAAAQGLMMAGQQKARATEGFFGSLGGILGGIGGIFGGGGTPTPGVGGLGL